MARQVNPEAVAYLKAVDGIVEARTGVRVTQLSTDFERDGLGVGQAANLAMTNLVPAEAFAAEVERSLNLRPVAEHDSPEAAKAANLRRASLVTFARDNVEWAVGADAFEGSVLKADQGQVVRMDVAPSRDGTRWGFALSVADDAILLRAPAADRVTVEPADADFRRVSAGPDIDDAVRGFNLAHDEAHVARPGM